MYKILQKGPIDFKKAITNEDNKMRGKNFRAYYLKKPSMHIINFVPCILNNYKPKRKRYVKMMPKISGVYLINPQPYFVHSSSKQKHLHCV